PVHLIFYLNTIFLHGVLINTVIAHLVLAHGVLLGSRSGGLSGCSSGDDGQGRDDRDDQNRFSHWKLPWVSLERQELKVGLCETLCPRADYIFSNRCNNVRKGGFIRRPAACAARAETARGPLLSRSAAFRPPRRSC